ncbi:hypothetical protein PAXINDRAFT_16975 [Paxillus involutus ATCC 200175]|uniref:Uncharacterized protein n=1 Tax=Paxillus involutus ATCC 200175 TaxID=664439 RepID=A0A0C9TQB5_PAXIN|nr:hypothetical protein PAXINDRAFT_16975 [Paxillus involutus ATCC 200175]
MNFYSNSFPYPEPHNGADGETMADFFSRHLTSVTSGQHSFGSPTFNVPSPPTFKMPPFNPAFSFALYPMPFNGADGQIFAQSFNQHYHHHFTEDQGQGVDVPAVVQLDLPHAQAVTFVQNRDIMLISVLEEVGAQRWVELCSHLVLLAWRNLTFDRFQPHQCIQKVHIIITPPKGASQIVPTHIDVLKFTDAIIKTLQSNIVHQFTSCIIYSSRKILEDHTPILGDPAFRDLAQIWLHWKGTGEGYGYFHKYEPLPGIGQARPIYFENPHAAMFQRAALTLNNATHFFRIYKEASDALGHSYFRPYQNSNIALFGFCSTCFMTSIDFILNHPNRKGKRKWPPVPSLFHPSLGKS